MKNVKWSVLVVIMTAAVASFATSTASATTLGLATGSTLEAEAETTTILHPPIGNIECKASKVIGKTSNEGGASETVKANVETLTFTECNATVTVLAKGSLEVHTKEAGANNNGTLTSSGTEVTVELFGFHCIFKTSNTDIGTLTGSANTGANATFDVEATIPRTGGRSGAFCGSTAQWTGSYEFTNPGSLNVDGESEGGPLRVTPGSLNFFFGVGQEKEITIEKKTSTTSVEVRGYSFQDSMGNPFTGIDITSLESCLTHYTYGTSCVVRFKDTRTSTGHGFIVLDTDHGTQWIGIHVT